MHPSATGCSASAADPTASQCEEAKRNLCSGRYQWGHILGIQNPKQGVYVVALGTEEYGGH